MQILIAVLEAADTRDHVHGATQVGTAHGKETSDLTFVFEIFGLAVSSYAL